MSEDQKKGTITDEWRHGTAEERLEYSLVKVTHFIYDIYIYNIYKYALRVAKTQNDMLMQHPSL